MFLHDTADTVPQTRSDHAGSSHAPSFVESEAERFQFLNRYSQALASARSPADVITALRRCVLPVLADWCLIQFLDEEGHLASVHAGHADPDKAGLARIAADYQPLGMVGDAWGALQTTEPVLVPEADRAQVARLARNDEHLALIQAMGLHAYMAVPLRCRGEIVGSLVLVGSQPSRQYGVMDLQLCEAIADRTALAIDNARLHDRLETMEAHNRTRTRALDLLAEATDVFVAPPFYVADTVARITRLLSERFADVGFMGLANESDSGLRQAASWHARPEQRPYVRAITDLPLTLDEGVGGHVFRVGRPFFMPDVSLTTLLQRMPLRYRKPLAGLHVVSLMVVPMRAGDRVIGVLYLLRTGSGPAFQADDLVLGQDLADRAGRAIEHARLYEAAERARKQAEDVSTRMTKLQHVTAALSAARTPRDVADVIVRAGGSVLHSQSSSVYEVMPDRRTIRLIKRLGGDPSNASLWDTMPIDLAAPVADVIRKGHPLFIDTLQGFIKRYPGLDGRWLMTAEGARAVLPLIANGVIIGAVAFAFVGDRAFSPDDQTFLLALADQCAHALERTCLDERLAQGEQEMRALINALPVLVAFVDHDHRYGLVNQAFARFVGQSQEQVAGRHIQDLWGQRLYQQLLPLLARVFAGDRVHVEQEISAFGHGPRWMVADLVPHVASTGDVTGCVVLLQDQTERKAMENRVAQALEYERRARLEADQIKRQVSVVASFSDGLQVSLDYDQTIHAIVRMGLPEVGDFCMFDALDSDGTLVRRAWASAEPSELTEAGNLQFYVPDMTVTTHPIVKTILTKEPLLQPYVDDPWLQQIALSDSHRQFLGQLHLQSALLVPVLSGDEVLGVLTFAFRQPSGRRHDQTHVLLAQALAWRAANAIHKASLYRDVQTALRVRDDFLSVASHELRTPLTSLGLQLEIIHRQLDRQNDASATEMIRPRLSRLHGDLDRLAALVSEIIDVTRLSSGHLPLAFGKVDVTDLLNEVVARFAPQFERYGSEVILDVPQSIVGHWDRYRLDQIVANLLSNAAKYGEGRPITVRATVVGEWLDLVVADQGLGIAVADQGRLFDRFERFAPIERYGGFGLGLWTVRRLVEAMGGSVTLVSDVGQGATFTVRLPLQHPDA